MRIPVLEAASDHAALEARAEIHIHTPLASVNPLPGWTGGGTAAVLPNSPSQDLGSLPEAEKPLETQQLSSRTEPWNYIFSSGWLDQALGAGRGSQVIFYLDRVAKPEILPRSKLLYLLCGCLWHAKHL